MLTDDHLLRQINQAAIILATILGLKKDGQLRQASQAAEQALEQLTGLKIGLVDAMQDSGLLALLLPLDRTADDEDGLPWPDEPGSWQAGEWAPGSQPSITPDASWEIEDQPDAGVFDPAVGLTGEAAFDPDAGQAEFEAPLSRLELDLARLELVADLLRERGEMLAAQERPAQARDNLLRALAFYLEAALAAHDELPSGSPGAGEKNAGQTIPGELGLKIDSLAAQFAIPDLSDETLWALAGYYEAAGAFPQAEAALQEMTARPEIAGEMRAELQAFYARTAGFKNHLNSDNKW